MQPLTAQDRINSAMERLDAAIARQQLSPNASRQSRFTDPQSLFWSIYKWVKAGQAIEPEYAADSRARDRWLRQFWPNEPHLAGVINSVVSIDKNRGWNLTGGRNQVLRFERILRDAEAGQGWRYFISQSSLSYYTSDLGAVVELGREGLEGGPLRALFTVDPTACRLTGNPERPLAYYDLASTKAKSYTKSQRGGQEWAPEDFFRVVPLPSNDQNLAGLGYCALSRCIRMAQIMIAVYEHDLEKLLARAPRGVLFLQNVAEHQWRTAMESVDAELSQKEREYFGAVAVIATQGAEPPDGKLLSLSQLPEGFNIETMTNLLMYAYALCFGYDPIEFWPVSAGALGRGRETDIQHRKGTGKGGVEFVFTLQDQLQAELPDTLLFQFEQRDAEGELLDANVAAAWANVVQTLHQNGAGVLTTEQALSYLIDKGVIPSDWTVIEEDASIDDQGEQRALFPRLKQPEGVGVPYNKRQLQRWREEAMAYEHVQRAVLTFPSEPIIRRHYLPGQPIAKTVVLWERGDQVKERHLWTVPDLRDLDRPFERPRRRATLHKSKGVTITDADVDAAIEVGEERLGAEFAGLLAAGTTEEEGEE